jgi:hypothetical protein
MKKILLFIFSIVAFGLNAKLNAQCTISQSSVLVNIHSVTSDPGGGCTTLFDLTFDIANNGGNKWSHLHIWDATAYPGLTYGNGVGPDSLALNGVTPAPAEPLLATVSMDYHLGTNFVSPTYPADPTNVHPETSGVTYTRTALPGGGTRFFIANISVHTSNCNPLDLEFDLWSAQDNNGKNIACGVTGLRARADEPQLRGAIQCATPRTFTISVLTKQDRNVTFTAYKDVAPFGTFDAADEANVVYGPDNTTIAPNPGDNTFHTYGPFPLPNPGGYNIWIKATATGIGNSNVIFVDNGCFPLPVKLTYFNARRNNATNVSLTWQTAQELNSSGFEIQRQVGSSGWQVVGFIPTQALNGTSASTLNYSFNDPNNAKGITQYRLRAVDIDANSKFSEIRAVRGDGQAGKIIVYPNPSFDGKVRVVFEDVNGTRDVSLTDISGRLVKQWTGITNNNLQIDNLTPGYYGLRVVIRGTGEQSLEKIVVNKR